MNNLIATDASALWESSDFSEARETVVAGFVLHEAMAGLRQTGKRGSFCDQNVFICSLSIQYSQQKFFNFEKFQNFLVRDLIDIENGMRKSKQKHVSSTRSSNEHVVHTSCK